MQSRNWIMLKMFLSAVATGAVVPAFLNGFGSSSCARIKAALYAAGYHRRADRWQRFGNGIAAA
jgi:hypothetical protein